MLGAKRELFVKKTSAQAVVGTWQLQRGIRLRIQ